MLPGRHVHTGIAGLPRQEEAPVGDKTCCHHQALLQTVADTRHSLSPALRCSGDLDPKPCQTQGDYLCFSTIFTAQLSS